MLLSLHVYFTSSEVDPLMQKWCEKGAVKVEVSEASPPASSCVSPLGNLTHSQRSRSSPFSIKWQGTFVMNLSYFYAFSPKSPGAFSDVSESLSPHGDSSQAETPSCEAEVVCSICIELTDVLHTIPAEFLNDSTPP